MSLAIVAISIGHPDDITLRAMTTLKEADVIIGEEPKVTRRLLKSLDILTKPTHFLNEHSTEEEIKELFALCRSQKVALVTDCGTPGFADPGYQLVRLCRDHKITVQPLPGASSLATLISVSGIRLDHFVFFGFLPRRDPERPQALKEVAKEKRAVILMDTPYRLEQLLRELSQNQPQRRCTLATNLTLENELIFEGTLTEALRQFAQQKAEFMILLHPLK